MKISMFMFITLLLIVWLITGCDLKLYSSEKVLSNAEIITAKNECEKGGMGFTVLSVNGNYAYPFKVVCTSDKCR